LPASSATREACRPAAPTTAFSTTSEPSRCASSTAASVPSPVGGEPWARASVSRPTASEPADSPANSKSSGWAAITSIACRPIEPVAPRTTTRVLT
jgi:hypothetical protein